MLYSGVLTDRPAMSRITLPHFDIEQALLDQLVDHPRDLVRVTCTQFGITRPTVLARIDRLIRDDYMKRSGSGTRPIYALGESRRRRIRLPLSGLAEDDVWSRHIAPLLADVPANVRALCHHGATEMINNAIDHSAGAELTLIVDRSRRRIAIVIDDDGVGIFRKITRHLQLPDERLALLELAKGKFTSDPKHHSGEGVFFSSRMFDRFQIHSNELVFDHDTHLPLDLLDEAGIDRAGTTVTMLVALDSTRTPQEIYAKYSSGPEEFTFARTVVPVRMARIGEDELVSRSQAKRLLERVDRFTVVEFDFSCISSIGQAFADEVFRVFAMAHPDVELIATHAATKVQQMVRRAEVARDRQRLNGDLFA